MKKIIYSLCFLLCGVNCAASAGAGCGKALKVCNDYHRDEARSESEKSFFEKERKTKQTAES